jgi:hypothetical protein
MSGETLESCLKLAIEHYAYLVFPAKAGIQKSRKTLGSGSMLRFARNDRAG